MAAYQVLARKWRPKTFADLVGQQHVVKALQNALDKGRLHHAYLLTGTRGVGKTTIARILAKSLNCENAEHGEPCGQCATCRDIDAGRFVDLLEIDAASNTGIDNIREVLENAQYAPTVGKYKVYIIDEVHMLSKSAFNAMLKTLEEPPPHVKFILATTDPHKVPITVLSRCLQFVLRNMTALQVSEHLTHVLKSEQVVYEPAALVLLGRAAQGSMRDALSLLDQAIAMGSGSVKESDVREMIGAVDKRYLYELLTHLMEQNGEQLIAKAQEMSASAMGFDSILNELGMVLQRLALLKAVPTAIDADDPEREHLLHLSQYFSDEQIQLYYQCVIHGKQDLPLAPDEYAGFVMTLLRMLAFAPFAAKHTPTNGTIEGTQLHSLPEKKNDIAPIVQKQFQPQDLPPAQREEIRREAPEVSGSLKSPNYQGKIKQNQNSENSAGTKIEPNSNSEKPNSEHSVETKIESNPNSENLAETPIEPNPKSENTVATEMEPHDFEYQDFSDSLNEENAHYDAYDYDFESLSTTPPDAQHDEADDEDEENEEEIIPLTQKEKNEMPAFQQENWLPITAKIAKSVAAAQMILNHLAWVNFQDGVLHLALMEDKITESKKQEYLDRIAHTLSDVYGFSVQIQTQKWQDGQNWETPSLYRERLAQEQRETARAALNTDKVAQQLLQAFDGKWVEESIVLI